jgi:hypothetical protein
MNDWRTEDRAKEASLTQAIGRWLKCDPGAMRFVLDVVYIAHLWDDLVDKDKERDPEEIGAAFKMCLFHLLENPFYARHIGELKPIMVNAYLGWHASNVLKDPSKQWFLRASIYNIIVHCAYLVGGMQWAEQVTPEIWGFYEEVIQDA